MNEPSIKDYERVVAKYEKLKALKEEMESNELSQESNTVNNDTNFTDSKPPISPRQAAVNVVGVSIWIFFGGCMLYLFGGLARWW